MTSLTLPAPAKLNLFLHITGQREDGYHLLQTVFRFLDYSDEITLTLRDDNIIQRVAGNNNVPEAEDLMIRAAYSLREHVSGSGGVDIAITKRIPMGGGLGGGSSNAATVLYGLNQLWGCGLSSDELARLGLQLGADVPVFIHGKAAWAEGVGEQLTPIDLPNKWYVVVAPDVHISTKEIFSKKELTRNMPPIKVATFLTGTTQNVFESVVRKQYPEVEKVFSTLSEYSNPKLTGSGACVFAEFNSQKEANQVLEKISKKCSGFVAKGVAISPLVF